MCLNKRYITNSLGKRVLVSCGQCAACQQQKALNRKLRIDNTFSKDTYPLFVTLTYWNRYIPYIRYTELTNCESFYNNTINIYRDANVRYVRSDRKYHVKKKEISECEILDTIHIDRDVLRDLTVDNSDNKLVTLHGCDDFDRIGVCYFKDVQDFVKRFRINLQRKNYDLKYFKSFQCSEFGPSSCRPHFHLLLFVPISIPQSVAKTAIVKAWPYADTARTYRYIEVAKNISSYISSYVNCSSSVPLLFQKVNEFKPKHSYSKGFGVAKEYLSISKVFEMYRRRDLHYTCQSVRNGCVSVADLLLPKYVISRYFPKFKGYSRFTCDQIRTIVFRPNTIWFYENNPNYGLTYDDCHSIEVMLENKLRFGVQNNIMPSEYADIYANIWSLRASQVYKDSFNDIQYLDDYLYLYDNMIDYFKGHVDGDFEFLYKYRNLDQLIIADCNYYPKNIQKHNNLVDIYNRTSKDRKIRNYIYSKNHFV